MDRSFAFHPPVRLGLIVNLGAIVLLTLLGGWALWRASSAQGGLIFLLYLLILLVPAVFIPILAYRAYALVRASYVVERDGIRLYWGLNEEAIPMDQVRWMRTSDDPDMPLPRLWQRWPGAVLGRRTLPDGQRVRYLAAQARPMVFFGSADRIVAISPENPQEFIRVCRQFAELGSLSPLPARSIPASFALAQVWTNRRASYLLLAGLVLSLTLLLAVGLIVPSRPSISLRSGTQGAPGDPVPSIQLFLLPIYNGFFFLADALLGLFFYRRPAQQVLAYILWGSSLFTSVLLWIALLVILGVF